MLKRGKRAQAKGTEESDLLGDPISKPVSALLQTTCPKCGKQSVTTTAGVKNCFECGWVADIKLNKKNKKAAKNIILSAIALVFYIKVEQHLKEEEKKQKLTEEEKTKLRIKLLHLNSLSLKYKIKRGNVE